MNCKLDYTFHPFYDAEFITRARRREDDYELTTESNERSARKTPKNEPATSKAIHHRQGKGEANQASAGEQAPPRKSTKVVKQDGDGKWRMNVDDNRFSTVRANTLPALSQAK